ncbi:lantibiotic dehydratase C-terminal domain-containing protein [Nonomuraea sp. CA-143628]|uniref:lantibiotic dehydratase C-terminal domain-containing protein n=1 Tax=Nonomuraea sp. CA-143628 TaxID=3239997 RepID=UPI003D931B3D
MTAPVGSGAVPGWISAHLFHAGSLDNLIAQVIAPLEGELREELAGFFFLRYWEGGPHLRLRVKPRGGGDAGRIRGLIRRRADAYFAEHPSVRDIPSADYQALAARLAHAERRADHEDRLYANDSVEFITYLPEHHVYGEGARIAAVEEHFTDSSRLACEILATGPAQGRRVAIGLAAYTLTMAAYLPDPQVAAQAFALRLGATPVPPDVEEVFRREAGGLLRQTRRLWNRPIPGPLAAWSSSIRTLRDRLTELGAALPDPADLGSPAAFLASALEPPANVSARAPSAHAIAGALEQSAPAVAKALEPPELGALTARAVPYILLRCTHLLHNRLGITPAAENRLALLTMRTLAALHER